MATPQDIRRQVGDVSPNNYTQPGVVDNSAASLAQTAGKLLEGGVALDAELARQRFGESIETLRTQYITGTGPQEVVSAAEEEPSEDGFVPTEQDKKSLADFGKTLDSHQRAVTQGKRSDAQFRIAAERLYRVAISKRPGLAREFRQVAEGFLGFDVVGGTVDVIAAQDKEFLEGQKQMAKTKAEQQADFIKRQREQFEKIYPESAFVPDEQWAAYAATKMPHFINATQKMTAGQLAAEESKLMELQGKKSQEVDTRFYLAGMDAIRSRFDSGIDKAIAQASVPDPKTGVKLIDSPQGMRQVMTGLRSQLLSEVSQLDQAVAGRDVDPTEKARMRSLVDATLTKLEQTLSLQDDAEFMERSNNVLKSEAERVLLNNDEARLIAAMDGLYGDVIMDRFIKDNGKTLALTASQIITNSMPPNQVTKVATRTVSNLIAAVWKQGSKTPPDPVATSRAAQDIANTISKFYLQDDANFRPQDFTQWQGRQGLLPMLTQRAPIIRPTLSDEESGEIAAQIAAASGNSALRLMSLLQKKSPGLVAKLDMASIWSPDTPGLARPKAGVTLTPVEQNVLQSFGDQFNRSIITKAMEAYGGGTPQESWGYIASQVRPMLDVKQEMTAAAMSQAAAQTAQDAAGGPSGGGGAMGVQAPQQGAVEDGWRFKGGDPSQPSSWEKVDGVGANADG